MFLLYKFDCIKFGCNMMTNTTTAAMFKHTKLNYKLFILILSVAFVAFPLSNNAYATKIDCADDVDLEKYPFCNYVDEWNEAQEWNEKVYDEMVIKAKDIQCAGHDEAHEGEHSLDCSNSLESILQEITDKVNQDNPGLKEKCEALMKWVYEQVKKDKERVGNGYWN